MPALDDHLFQPGQPLDIRRYYVVLPDGIGAGGSTKPQTACKPDSRITATSTRWRRSVPC